MAIRLRKTGPDWLRVLAPTAVNRPFTIGMWYKAVAGAVSVLTSVNDGTIGWEIYFNSTGPVVRAGYWTGSATQGTASATTVADQWNFVVARLITTASKRVANLLPSGAIAHVQNTSTTTEPTTLVNVDIGGWEPYCDGDIAEWWLAGVDVQPDGLQLKDDLLRQLAYKGPFSVPYIAANVLQYRSFRRGLLEGPGDTYFHGTPLITTVMGAPAMAEHPPICGDYVKPPGLIGVPRMLLA